MLSKRNLNAISAILMLVFVAALFLPYYGMAGSVSLMEYFGFPLNHAPTEAAIASVVDGYTINDISWSLLLMLALSILGGILMLRYRERRYIALFGAGFGIAGLAAFLGNPALALGSSAVRGLYIAIFAVVTLLSGLSIAGSARETLAERRQWRAAELEAERAQALRSQTTEAYSHQT